LSKIVDNRKAGRLLDAEHMLKAETNNRNQAEKT